MTIMRKIVHWAIGLCCWTCGVFFDYMGVWMDLEAAGAMYEVVPRQIIKWGHAEAGDNRSFPLFGKQLLPHAFLGSQWLLHLMGLGEVSVKSS